MIYFSHSQLQQQLNNLPNHSLQLQQQQKPNQQSQQQQSQPFSGSTINSQNQPPIQQQFPIQSDQFSLPSHSHSQLPQLPQQLGVSSASKISSNQQQLNYSQQQQGTGLTNKPAFLDPASLFSQDNNSNNNSKSNNLIQSTSLSSQNPMIQTSASTTVSSAGTFNRHLPNQGDIISHNQLKSNLHQQHHQQQQQQQQQLTQLLNQQQQPFQQLQQQPQQLYQPTSSYSSNQFDQSMSFMRSNENQINNR